MHREREILVRAVFPRLAARFAASDLALFEVDLRWGITQELAETRGALDLCLLEIDRCCPLFFCMLGHRYGWCPPEETGVNPGPRSVTELEVLHTLQGSAAREASPALSPVFFLRAPALSAQVHAAEDNPEAMENLRRGVRESPRAEIHEYSSFEEFEREAEIALAGLIDRWKASADGGRIPAWRGVSRPRQMQAITAAASRGPAILTGERNMGLTWLGTEWTHSVASSRHMSAVIDCRRAKGERGIARAVRELRLRRGSVSAAEPKESLELGDELLSLGAEVAAARGDTLRLFVDHFEEAYAAESRADLNAIPLRLPDALQLVIATRSDRCVRLARDSSLSVVDVGVLESASVREFSKAYLDQYGKHLTASQFGNLADSNVCAAVGSLVLCLDELRRFHSHELLNDRLRKLASLPGHHEVCLEIVDGLRRAFGEAHPDAVERVLIALALSVNGLEESEICAAFGTAGAEHLPPHVWIAIRTSLSRCLIERGARVDLAAGGIRQVANELRVQRRELASVVGETLLENLARSNRTRWIEEAPNVLTLLGGLEALQLHLQSVARVLELHEIFPIYLLGWLDQLGVERIAQVFTSWELQLAQAGLDAADAWELGLLAAKCGAHASARALWMKARALGDLDEIYGAVEALLLRDARLAERVRLTLPGPVGQRPIGDRWIEASTMLALAAEGLIEMSADMESAWIAEATYCVETLNADALGAQAWILVGQLNIARARWKRAFEAFQKAIAFARRSGHARRLCAALERNALVSIELNKFSRASELATECLEISRESGLFEQECLAFERLIEIERQRADWPAAFQLAEQYILRTRGAARNLDRAMRCLQAIDS